MKTLGKETKDGGREEKNFLLSFLVRDCEKGLGLTTSLFVEYGSIVEMDTER